VVVWINGEACELADDARVADALGALGLPRTGVAVAVDGEVVPRTRWADAATTSVRVTSTGPSRS